MNVDSGYGHKQVNLVQYRRIDGRWQFIRVVRKNGKPDPRLVLINGVPTSSKGGHFYLAWREKGRLKRQAVGSSPREALNAWHVKMGILTEHVEPDPEPETAESKTIDAAIAGYLRDVKATKSTATCKAYKRDLAWFREHCGKHLVSRLDRSDVMVLFASGREERLNQKTTNKRVVVMLQAMRGGGADIKLRKGDWPKTADKQVEVYTPDELQKFFAACTDDERVLFSDLLADWIQVGRGRHIVLAQHSSLDRQDQRVCKTSVELHTEELRNSIRRSAVCFAHHPQCTTEEQPLFPRVPRPKTSDAALLRRRWR